MMAMQTIMIMMIAIRGDKHGKDDNDGNADNDCSSHRKQSIEVQ